MLRRCSVLDGSGAERNGLVRPLEGAESRIDGAHRLSILRVQECADPSITSNSRLGSLMGCVFMLRTWCEKVLSLSSNRPLSCGHDRRIHLLLHLRISSAVTLYCFISFSLRMAEKPSGSIEAYARRRSSVKPDLQAPSSPIYQPWSVLQLIHAVPRVMRDPLETWLSPRDDTPLD